MDYQTFRERLFDIALRNGCTGAETYRLEDVNFSVGVLDQKIDNYSVSRAVGIGLRVQVDGRNGYAYTEAMDDPDSLVAHAIDNARSIETKDEHPLQVPQEMPPVERTPDPLCALDETARIDAALRLERLVLAHGDPVTKSAETCCRPRGAQFPCITPRTAAERHPTSRLCLRTRSQNGAKRFGTPMRSGVPPMTSRRSRTRRSKKQSLNSAHLRWSPANTGYSSNPRRPAHCSVRLCRDVSAESTKGSLPARRQRG
jgi:hypothetical protein